MLPRVVLHVEASLDARIDWIQPDVGRFYALAGEVVREDAILTGADTLLEGPGLPEAGDDEPPTAEEVAGSGPLLVVVDSRGRFDRWNWLRKQVYWRDVVALVSGSTPQSALDRLRARQVETCSAGEDWVDLRAALEWLNAAWSVQTVRVDSGGALSGVLLRAGLLHEVSVLLEPVLVGGAAPRTFVRGPDPESPADVLRLELMSAQPLEDGVVWLRYRVEHRAGR